MSESPHLRCRELTAGDRPGYEEAVEAVANLARRPRCSDWGEGLTEPRCRAIIDATYPAIHAGVIAEVTAWLRREARPGGECGLFPERLVGMFERDFGGSA